MMVEARWPNLASPPSSQLLSANARRLTGTAQFIEDPNSTPAIRKGKVLIQDTLPPNITNDTLRGYSPAETDPGNPDGWTGSPAASVVMWSGNALGSQSGKVIQNTNSSMQVRPRGTYEQNPEAGFGPDLSPSPGWPSARYAVSGKLILLDTSCEWYINPNTGYLYVYLPYGAKPTTGPTPTVNTVFIKRRNYAFDLRGKMNVTIEGFKIFASTVITDNASSLNYLDRIQAKYVSHFTDTTLVNSAPGNASIKAHVGDTGIILKGERNSLVNSKVEYSAGNGVLVAGNYTTVRNNVIHDTDYMGSYCAPVYVSVDNSLHSVDVSYNTVYNTARDGIAVINWQAGYRDFSNSQIAYNDVYNYGRFNADLGGIYIASFVNGVSATNGARSIHHNWVHDNKAEWGVGIYIDNGSQNFLVHHNVLWNNVGDGFRLNPGYNPTLSVGTSYGNRIYNNTVGLGHTTSIGSTQAFLAGYGYLDTYFKDPNGSSPTHIKNNILMGSNANFQSPMGSLPFAFGYPSLYPRPLGAEVTSNFQNKFLVQDGTKTIEPSNNWVQTDFSNVFTVPSPIGGTGYQLGTSSPARSKGEVLSGVTTTTVPDVGAYEGGSWVPGAR
jgi:hypothetical protein